MGQSKERLSPEALHNRALLAVAFLGIIWGATYLGVKLAMRAIPVFMLAGIRELLAGLIFLLGSWIWEKPQKVAWRDLFIQGLYGLGFFTGARGLMALALEYASSGLVALVFSLIPVYVFFLNAFTGQFRFNRRILAGLALGAIGMVLVFRESLFGMEDSGQLIGIGIAFLAALSWAGTSVLLYGKPEPLPLLLRSASQLIVGAMGLLLISTLRGEQLAWEALSWEAVGALLYLVLFGSIAGFGSYAFAIRHLPVARATLYAYINPFVALFLGWLVLGEALSLELLLSFCITLLGVYWVNQGYRQAAAEVR